MGNKLILFIGFFLLALTAKSTHNRAGEITYRHINALTYEVTVTTYTDVTNPSNADRPYLELLWGDGSGLDSLARSNGIINGGVGTGVIIAPGIKENVYVGLHTYAGLGCFTVSVEDPNRNYGVVNFTLTQSVNIPFYIETELCITAFGVNNSVVLDNPPLDQACVNEIFLHNPGAFDPDGMDSLGYSLVPCSEAGGLPVVGYAFPDQIGGGPANQISIDPITGEFLWESPQLVGEYNIAILIEEYRKDQNGIYQKIGSVLRDMQIEVLNCNNDPPEIEPIQDTCIEVGTTLIIPVNASDPNIQDDVILTASGELFSNGNFGAVFNPPSISNPVSQNFIWTPTCDDVRLNSYQVIFRAEDDAIPVSLIDLESVFITVVAPAPENPSAIPQGNNMNLVWDQSICSNAIGYKIYRRIDSIGFTPNHCETGVPAYTGYTQIGTTTSIADTMFTDFGLSIGEEYCYMVVACFPDGAQSYASEEFCVELIKEFPVITHVTVNETNLSTGIDSVIWSNPTEVDTLVAFSGPYSYKVYSDPGFFNNGSLIFTSPNYSLLSQMDSVFVYQNINTESTANAFRIEVYSGADIIGASNNASSVFLSLSPEDNQVTLSWQAQVPWNIDSTEVYKETSSGSGVFNLIATTTDLEYTDTGLLNGQEYCYQVKTIGSYNVPSIPYALINWSQKNCEIPIDQTPPCPPVFTFDGDCTLDDNLLTWSNPNNNCTDDVIQYNIYYAPTDEQNFSLLTTINSAVDTFFYHNNNGSLAGCYYVTALDSINLLGNQNESDPSEIFCLDNCPEYSLPNVFTPNGDGRNDLFVSFPYRFVESIDLKIYNRWGNLLFETTDPAIQWNGTNQKSNNEELSEGVYYYMCKVNSVRLSGIVSFDLAGKIHLLKGRINNK